jgi:glutaredoxin
MAAPRVVLYTRVGCHLCDDMKRVVEAVAASVAIDFREVDIDTKPDLRRLYDWEVPVLEIDGRKAFKYRVAECDLRKRISVRNADDRD